MIFRISFMLKANMLNLGRHMAINYEALAPEGEWPPGKAARWLGVTTARLRQLVIEGHLTWRLHEGIHYLKSDEVRKFAETYSPNPVRQRAGKKHGAPPVSTVKGKLAAKIFRCFKAGMNLADTVIETGSEPPFVRQCWREYRLDFEAGEKERAAVEEEKKMAAMLREFKQEDNRERFRAFQIKMAEERAKRPILAVATEAMTTGAPPPRTRNVR